MKPSDRDVTYLWDMRQSAGDIADLAAGLNFDAFVQTRAVRLAVERSLEIIGEAARRVSPDFKASQPSIPWSDIIGQRNILAHDYGEIQLDRVWKVVTSDIPVLIANLDAILAEAPPPPEP